MCSPKTVPPKINNECAMGGISKMFAFSTPQNGIETKCMLAPKQCIWEKSFENKNDR